MSLTRKLTIIVALVFLLSAFANWLIQQVFVMPSFICLEKKTANDNAKRAAGAIDHELDQIAPSVSDWAYWTDTYKYVKGQKPEFAEENLNAGSTLQALKVNFLGIFDLSGKALWSKAIELETEAIVDLGQLTEKQISTNHPLLQHTNLKSEVKGIISTIHSPMLVVAKPILTNDRKGPVVGTVIMGRFLNDKAVHNISELIKLPITIKMLPRQRSHSGLPDFKQGLKGLMHTDLKLVETAEKWQAKSTISDIFGLPILELEVDTSRNISAMGAKAVNQSLAVLAGTGLLMVLMMWKLLKATMLRPIARLTEHALRIGENDNLRARLNVQSKDEFGILGQTFDRMVDRLAETRRCLIEQSYHSGVAEMASGVLHNIGNAITPLNIRLAKLEQELKTALPAELDQAAAELANPLTPADRRADLQQFVELAGGEMAGLLQVSQKEISASLKAVGQVQEILADQQRFSHSARLIEPVDMAELIQEAASALRPDFKTALQLEITPGVMDIGPVAGSRAVLHQVVTNLLINAAESIQAAGIGSGYVTVTAGSEVLQGKKMVGFCFADNGCGINPEHLGRLFERGFSTKNREGSGYGLHWSANTIQAFGGQISVASAGKGQGACMQIFLQSAENLIPKNNQIIEVQDGIRH